MIETIILKSEALNTNATIDFIRPNTGHVQNLMILLHGNMNSESSVELFHNLPEELELEALCDKYHMMTVMPLTRNRYYISTDDYDCGKYVASELPDYIKQRYELQDSIEIMLAGISMGGYGATLIAAHSQGLFSKIISLSGAYIAKDVEIGNPEVWGSLTPNSADKNTFLHYFLPLSDLKESTDRNALTALKLFKEHGERPKFVVTCGTEDWLYKRNLDFLKELDFYGIDYVFNCIDGGNHDPDCFRRGLWNAVEYFNDTEE